ncbi:hypothetical protein ACH9EU_03875 [Kocuria sp. M1R5S2]|uniref:hypothetical protein n=1 Tax=Kocuria rhizosphaerae TaxID=3376285 RepID=UPI0037B22DE4
MDPELDPKVRHAVEHPAETARGPEEPQLRVRVAGEPARRALGAHWADAPEDSAPDDDRLAAAVLLATLFGDTFWLERAAKLTSDVPGCPSAPPSGLLELTRVPGARAAMARVLERPVLTGLLEWGTNPVPEQPPLTVARAARDLGIPDDGRVYRVVRRRAERFLAREHDGSESLEQFVTLLTQAEKGHREDGPVLTGETLPPAPPPPSATPPAAGTPGAGTPPPDTSPQAPPYTSSQGPAPGAPPPYGSPQGAPDAPAWGEGPPASPSGPPGQEPGRGPAWPGGQGPAAGPGGWPPPRPPEEEEDDTDNLKAWGIVFLVIVGVIAALVLVL